MKIYSPAKGSSIPDSTVFGLRLVTILKFTNTREFANQLVFFKFFPRSTRREKSTVDILPNHVVRTVRGFVTLGITGRKWREIEISKS